MNLNLFSETGADIPVDFPTSMPQITARIDRVNPLQYGKTRNFLNGAVTYLSPYISRGVISVKQVMETVLQKGYQPGQIEKFLQELAWREYFQRVYQHAGEGIFKDLKHPQPDVQHHRMISSVEQATTGVEAIDRLIQQLYNNGYMHNHVRMYTAAIICNIGKAHWLQPSRWLYYHLLDGDIASNNCSWQWVAGAFSSKKYYCNQENINKYTFSKQRHSFLDRTYEELTAMPIPEALIATTASVLETRLPATAFPVIDTGKPTLIYNACNLDPLWHKEEDMNRILLLEPSHFNNHPVSQKVLQFIVELSRNIAGIQVYAGEIKDIVAVYEKNTQKTAHILSKEHPAFTHYPGTKESRDWMFPQVDGYYPSFFAYWKNCVTCFS